MKKTAFYEEHLKLNGRMIDFGGWCLPVQYTGLMDEHLNCRTNAGIFDVSHMGEITVKGSEAKKFLQEILTNNIDRITDGQAQYHLICNENGGVIDDLIIYQKSDQDYLLVVNASNVTKDFDWIFKQSKNYQVKVENISNQISQIALQGPKAQEILQELCREDLSHIKPFYFKELVLKNDLKALVSRTGYTGEDGFEIYLDWEKGPLLWTQLLEYGKDKGLKPCGLGARDTLRLEVKYPLYGNELNETLQPLQAGLAWAVKLEKPKFIGKEAMTLKKHEGYDQVLVGIEIPNGGIPRQGYKIFNRDQEIGWVTSGTQSPTTKKAIALAYLLQNYSKIGTPVEVLIRDKKIMAQVCQTPFYKRPS